jgi:hypothetical protein
MSTLTNIIPAPAAGQDAVQSHGTYTGQCIAAKVVLNADITTQELGNSLQVIFSKMATTLAGIEVSIQDQLAGIQQTLWTKNGMDEIEKIIQANDPKHTLTDDQRSAISVYSTQLGAAQSAIQAGTKGLDPVLTPTQNMPQAITTSLNEEMNETGSVISGMSFVAQCKIS